MNGLQIGILNLSSHENHVQNVAKIATEIGSVSIFSTREIYDRVKNTSCRNEHLIDWVVMKHLESEREFLARVENKIDAGIDILISFPFYGNILDYMNYASFNPDCEYFLYAFDINSILGINPTLTLEMYNYLKYPLKKMILYRTDHILVEYPTIAKYVSSENPSISVESFTPVLYDSSEKSGLSVRRHEQRRPNLLTITVPGMIDSTRRNYNELLEALNKLPEERKEQIRLILLGKPIGDYGSTIIERAKSLQKDGIRLEYYTDWIPSDTFARKLNSTDVLVNPLRRHRPIDGFVEQYGKSKGSGAIGNSISYATPLLLPSWFEVPEQTEPGIDTYHDSAGLQRILTKLIENDDYRREWSDGAWKMAQDYSKSRQSERLQQIIGKK